MYILIDRSVMAITHKHHDREVLAKLSWIECTNAGVTVPLTGVRAFLDFSNAELKLIYKHGTGADLKGIGGAAQAVLEMARRLPETQAVLAEVTAQALCISDGDKSCYRYVFGAMKPEELATLYEPNAIQVERCEAEELRASVATTAAAPYVPPIGPNPFAHPAAAASSANANAPAPVQRAPAAPRVGGTRDTIFRVADEMWTAAGSPNDLPHILSLRKQIMVELEANHSIKKTTSSTALGDWQKQRLT